MASSTEVSRDESQRFRLLTDEEVETMADPEWLIKDVLPAGSFAVLFGTPGIGKSFVSLDIAWSIAAGMAWQGREVKKGCVVYVAAEGRSGLKLRRNAWYQEHALEHCPNAFYLPEPVQLTNDEDLSALLNSIRALRSNPVLVVIDTLARCFVGMDENSSREMGKLVAAIDRLRAETSATVLLIHHAGKPRTSNPRKVSERGSSALSGAADVMMSLVPLKSGPELKCEKQKDAEPFAAIPFQLKSVTVGDSQQSCVVRTSRRCRKVTEARPRTR